MRRFMCEETGQVGLVGDVGQVSHNPSAIAATVGQEEHIRRRTAIRSLEPHPREGGSAQV